MFFLVTLLASCSSGESQPPVFKTLIINTENIKIRAPPTIPLCSSSGNSGGRTYLWLWIDQIIPDIKAIECKSDGSSKYRLKIAPSKGPYYLIKHDIINIDSWFLPDVIYSANTIFKNPENEPFTTFGKYPPTPTEFAYALPGMGGALFEITENGRGTGVYERCMGGFQCDILFRNGEAFCEITYFRFRRPKLNYRQELEFAASFNRSLSQWVLQ